MIARATWCAGVAERRDEVDVGDVLITSGRRLPLSQGIPGARVKAVEKKKFGVTNRWLPSQP